MVLECCCCVDDVEEDLGQASGTLEGKDVMAELGNIYFDI